VSCLLHRVQVSGKHLHCKITGGILSGGAAGVVSRGCRPEEGDADVRSALGDGWSSGVILLLGVVECLLGYAVDGGLVEEREGL
jgi:hypothetical protein